MRDLVFLFVGKNIGIELSDVSQLIVQPEAPISILIVMVGDEISVVLIKPFLSKPKCLILAGVPMIEDEKGKSN